MRKTGQCSRDHRLFSIRIVVIVAPFHTGRDPIGAQIPLLVNWSIFFQFFPILQAACLDWHPPRVQRHGPQTISCQVKIWWSWWVYAGCCDPADPAVRGLFVLLGEVR